jgi:NADPH:quinone reductase-like Zn-dependent oxidoreductase
MRAYEIAAGSSSLEGLRRCERPDPSPLPHQILVRVKAASLNYRDLLIPRGHYMGGAVASSTIPLSDGAGEVVAIAGAAGSPYGLLGKQASLQGVYVGSRGHFERMNAAISAHRLEPIIDREFSFDDAPAAYRHLESGAHFGKVAISL